jgi:hypothetical protein
LLRALRLRNTGDWRIAQSEKRLTLLESLEEFRALAWGQDDQAAVAWVEPRKPPMIADWGRIAQSVNVYSVETSNRFADMSLAWIWRDGGLTGFVARPRTRRSSSRRSTRPQGGVPGTRRQAACRRFGFGALGLPITGT